MVLWINILKHKHDWISIEHVRFCESTFKNWEGKNMGKMEIKIEEGKYAIGVETLQKDTDEPSAMANYLSKMAIVTRQDDFLTLSLLLQSQKTIIGFQVENQAGELIEAIEQQVDDEMDRRFEMFELDHLTSIVNVRVQYEVDHEGQKFKGDEALRLQFNEESLEKLD